MRRRSSTSRVTAALFAALTCMLAHGVEHAEAVTADTATMTVAVGVDVRCSVGVGTLDFPDYVSGQATDDVTTTNVVMTCDPGRRVAIKMGQGLYPAAGSTDRNPRRQMASGANRLAYNIYEDAAHTVVWDNQQPPVRGPKTFPWVAPVYGRIPALQTVLPGGYSDTVIVSFFY